MTRREESMADHDDSTFHGTSGRRAEDEARGRRVDGARLREHREEIRRDGEALAQHVGALIGDLEDDWGERAVEHPYAVVGTCLAIGYVLGGGLPSGFVRLAAGMAGRLTVAAFARGALEAAAERR
jgi:ElaB/YqjD/DUF883 family membrane-anchored ribosome-binding protein